MTDPFGFVAGTVGLALPLFQVAKKLRDQLRLAAYERKKVQELIEEYEEEMAHLGDLYNTHKDVLDQQALSRDAHDLQHKTQALYDRLLETQEDMGEAVASHFKDVWKAGDLNEDLECLTRRIARVRSRWQDRVNTHTLSLMGRESTRILDRLDTQARALTNGNLTVVETIRVEATEVIKAIRGTEIRNQVLGSTLHPQVGPGVLNGQPSKVLVTTSSSTVSFSIMSAGVTLQWEHIKTSLDDYRRQLGSNSPAIEFHTDTGRRIIRQDQAQSVGTLICEAERLLQKIVESGEESTIVAIQHLRDLAWFLDKLKLEKECRLVGNCALHLAQVHVVHSEEFRADHADTLVAIGLLSSYSARARTLFAQALLLGEEILNDDEPPPILLELLRAVDNKCSFTHTTKQIPGLAVQCFTVQIGRTITMSTWREKELWLRILLSYREFLHDSSDHAAAAIIEGESLALHHSLASREPAKYNYGLSHFLVNHGATMSYLNHLTEALCLYEEAVALARNLGPDGSEFNLARALQTYGITLHGLSRYTDALATNNEALSIYRRLADSASLQRQVDLANMLYMHQFTLGRLNHHADAVAAAQEAVSIYDRLTDIQPGRFERELSVALHSYGWRLVDSGEHANALSPFERSISLRRALVEKDPNLNTLELANTIHDRAISLHLVGRTSEADAAATECLQLCNGTSLENCQYEPDLSRCFVCRRASYRA